MSSTRNLALPLIAAAQAQKHVTHNEALTLLDALVQIACLDKDLASPPPAPAEGDRYLVASAQPGGAWTGFTNRIALFQDGAWTGLAPRTGWLAYVVDEADLYVFTGSAWASFRGTISALQNLARLGINTAADAGNRLAVKAEGALFSWDEATPGSGSMRLTLNKQEAAKDAGFTVQTGYSSRALFGTLGSDDFTLKVSPDGAAFATVLTASAATGRLTLARINGPLEISAHAGALPAAPADAVLRVSAADGAAARLVADAYGNAAGLALRAAGGTAAAPAGLAAGQAIGAVSGHGYGATGYGAAGRVQILFQAAEAWSDAAQGARIVFGTTPIGGTATADAGSFEPSGAFRLAPRAADPDGGSLGQIVVNSTATALKWHNGTAWARLNNFAKFVAYLNFDQLCPGGQWTKVQFNNADSNDQGVFNAGTNVFTAPEPGLYRFSASAIWKVNAGGRSTTFELQFYRNGATAGRGRVYAGNLQEGQTGLCLTTVLKLNAGDTVGVYARMGTFAGFVSLIDNHFAGEQLA